MKRSPLLFLLVTAFLFSVGMSLVFPVLPFIVAQYVPDARQQTTVIGWLAALFALLSFFSSPVLGAVSDAYGRRPVLILTLLGTALGNLVFGIGGSLAVLFLGRFLEGVTSGGMGALMAYVADSTNDENRGAVFGQIGATVGAGMIVGPALGGLLAHFGYSAPMFVAAGIAVLNALWGYFFLPESLKPENRQHEFTAAHLNPLTHLRSALIKPQVRQLVFTAMLFMLPFTLMQIVLPIMTRDTLHWGAAEISTLFMVSGLCDIVGQGVVLPRLLARFGERRVALGGIVMGVMGVVGLLALAGLVAWPHAALFYAAVIVFALGEGLFTSSINALISLSIPEDEQGRVQGGVQSLFELTQIAGPLAGSGMYAHFGSAPTFGLGAGLAAVAYGLLSAVPARKA
ncbi:MFS transporter [Deinococcus sp. HMF7604]|uniref:MFS transporter n=1 Tax=Deinococcus betulae TaxID=2873312 RepID=UPI001CCDE2D1|nr:MFS transporter [Deinococcus betulae]MBZ9752857.1 MFS transporter [Deinococcus betulae]